MITSFTQFYRHFSQNRVISSALQNLENHFHWYPSILLLIVWHVKNHYGRLSQVQLRQLQKVVQQWHERLVNGLNRLNQTVQMKCGQDILTQIQQLEQLSLTFEANMLEDYLTYPKTKSKPENHLVRDVCQNILLYGKLLQSPLNDDAIKSIKLYIVAVFPEQNLLDIEIIVEQQLKSYPALSHSGEQLIFDV